MRVYKIGERVECVEGDDTINTGERGTVIEDSIVPYVEWDNGKVWAMTCYELQPIEAN